MPSYAQPAVLLTDTNSSSAVRDSTTAYKNRATALFVPLCCCQHGSEPAQPNRNPIDLTASAANASGSLQTTLSKLPRPRHQCATASHLGAVPIGIYRFPVPNLAKLPTSRPLARTSFRVARREQSHWLPPLTRAIYWTRIAPDVCKRAHVHCRGRIGHRGPSNHCYRRLVRSSHFSVGCVFSSTR